jgi:uncharacterized Zn-binding protein involved in type VI secretion
MVTPGLPPIPHVGGPVVGPGCPTVLIGGMPAAVMGDMCVCVGPPDSIVLGSTGVMIGNKPAARMGDMCAHGGSIVVGCPTVLIGEMSPGSPPPPPVINMLMLSSASASSDHSQKTAQVVALKRAAESGAPFCEKCEAARKAKEKEEEEKKKKDDPTQKAAPSHWFEVSVVPAPDESPRPAWWPSLASTFSGVSCSLQLPGEPVEETGKLDDRGNAVVENVDSGNASLHLDGIARDVEAVAAGYQLVPRPSMVTHHSPEEFIGFPPSEAAAKMRDVTWKDLQKPIEELATDTRHEIRVKREVIPIIFVPGVMGSVLRVNDAAPNAPRPEDKGLPRLRWNPSSERWMARWFLGRGGWHRTKMLIGQRGYSEDYLEVNSEREDGWDGVFSAYHKFLEPLKNHYWGALGRLFDFPVIAFGYNWTASNRTSAEKLAKRVSAAIAEGERVAGKGRCPGVILVTHSMGGLVARACCKLPEMAGKVLGVVHGVQPATGATSAYWRVKCGVEGGIVGSLVLGMNAEEVTPILASTPGPLQLLPNKRHRTNTADSRWLRIVSSDGTVLDEYPKADPYSEIYGEPASPTTSDYWKLVDPRLLVPSYVTPGVCSPGDSSPWSSYISTLKRVQEFHDWLGDFTHARTISIAGTNHTTVDTVEYIVETDYLRSLRSQYRNGGFRAEFRTPSGTPMQAELQDPEGEGDGTVPLASAFSLAGKRNGKLAAMDRQIPSDHQSSYEVSDFRRHAIASIEALCALYRLKGPQ